MNRRVFLKRMNWALAGIIGLLGFAGCKKESGANYTINGDVVNKATGKPIVGIRVGYSSSGFWNGVVPMYGTLPTLYEQKAHVTTDEKGEFVLTDHFYTGESHILDHNRMLHIIIEDIDGKKNGLFQTEYFQVDFPKGKFTVNLNVELTEITE